MPHGPAITGARRILSVAWHSRLYISFSIGAVWISVASASPPTTVSFRNDIVPELKVRCATCHLSGDEPGGMALHPGAAYKSLVNVPSTESNLLRVRPGAPDQSYLFAKITGRQLDVGGKGVRMPFGENPLNPATIGKIRTWIAQGARDN